MQKHVNLVDIVKSFPTNIYLQNLASIQKRTSPVKFAHLAEKSGKGSISSLSTKVGAREFSKPVLSFEFSSDMEENARGSTSDTVKYTMDVVVPEVSKISKIRKILQN